MTPERFRFARAQLGLEHSDHDDKPWHRSAPKFLGVDPSTVRKWARGKAPIPPTCAILLEIMTAYRIMPNDLADLNFDL